MNSLRLDLILMLLPPSDPGILEHYVAVLNLPSARGGILRVLESYSEDEGRFVGARQVGSG